MNAFVQAPVTEKVLIVIDRALNCLKSAGAAIRSHFARCIEYLGYESCKAHLDLFLKPDIRPEDGVKFYSYLLCNVDDMLCIHHDADFVPEWFCKSFPLILGFGKPDMYLGANLHETRLYSGVCKGVKNCTVHLLTKYVGKKEG